MAERSVIRIDVGDSSVGIMGSLLRGSSTAKPWPLELHSRYVPEGFMASFMGKGA
jgi:hypothetical protein